MARVARLAGALLAETEGVYYLVGNTKRPCDFAAMGFAPPRARDPRARPYLELTPQGVVEFEPPWLRLALEGRALLELLSERLLIARDGLVSDPLWRLITGQDDDEDTLEAEEIDARWLGEIPVRVWDMVRDNVLRSV